MVLYWTIIAVLAAAALGMAAWSWLSYRRGLALERSVRSGL
jgi:hypothetical protein